MEPDNPVFSLGAMLDALPIVAFLARPDGSISFMSRGWSAFAGSDPATVLGEGYLTLIHPDHRDRVGALWRAAQIAPAGYRDEMPLRVGDGSYRWIVSQAQPMRCAHKSSSASESSRAAMTASRFSTSMHAWFR